MTFVQEKTGNWSEFLISTPLGCKFVGEGAWGTGVNFNLLEDTRVVIFAEGEGLLSFSDFLVYILEEDWVSCETEPNDEQNSEKQIEENRSNVIIDIVFLCDNLDNAYALGLDLVDYIVDNNLEGRIVNCALFLSDQKEDMSETFDCKGFLGFFC